MKRTAGKLATNSNENQASEVSSEEVKSENEAVLQTGQNTESIKKYNWIKNLRDRIKILREPSSPKRMSNQTLNRQF